MICVIGSIKWHRILKTALIAVSQLCQTQYEYLKCHCSETGRMQASVLCAQENVENESAINQVINHSIKLANTCFWAAISILVLVFRSFYLNASGNNNPVKYSTGKIHAFRMLLHSMFTYWSIVMHYCQALFYCMEYGVGQCGVSYKKTCLEQQTHD